MTGHPHCAVHARPLLPVTLPHEPPRWKGLYIWRCPVCGIRGGQSWKLDLLVDIETGRRRHDAAEAMARFDRMTTHPGHIAAIKAFEKRADALYEAFKKVAEPFVWPFQVQEEAP